MDSTKSTPTAGANELMTEDMSFLEQFAGAGFDDMGADATAVAYLGLVQPGSTNESADNPAGTWRNSATGENYGSDVKAVVLAFRTIWNEREAEPPFRTVARYAPNSIKVDVRQPAAGKRGFPRMVNPETGNEIQELFVYAVALPDYPEAGVLYFQPTVGSMRTCKSWNSQLKGQLLPNGAQAPIFGFQWVLHAELVPNPQQPSKQVAKFTHVEKDAIVGRDIFTAQVQPQLSAVQQAVLQITSDSDMAEEE